MTDWRKHLPKPKPTQKVIQAVMVRPSAEACEWLVQQSEKHGVSVNQIVVAMIEAERNVPTPTHPKESKGD